MDKQKLIEFAKSELACWTDEGDYHQLLRIALAAMEAEPVAWEVKGVLCHTKTEADQYIGEPEPLYTAPPAPTQEDNRNNEALHTAVAAIYFDDSSDFKSAIWSIVRTLNSDIAALLEHDEKAAFNQSANLSKVRLNSQV